MERRFRQALRAETIDTNYDHIKRDLKRIFLLALSFIAIMVALSFFIR